MSSTSSSAPSTEDINITDNNTAAQLDSGQTTAAGQGYTVSSKAKPRKQQQQQQENEQPTNQE
jgi:hypothetical protein